MAEISVIPGSSRNGPMAHANMMGGGGGGEFKMVDENKIDGMCSEPSSHGSAVVGRMFAAHKSVRIMGEIRCIQTKWPEMENLGECTRLHADIRSCCYKITRQGMKSEGRLREKESIEAAKSSTHKICIPRNACARLDQFA